MFCNLKRADCRSLMGAIVLLVCLAAGLLGSVDAVQAKGGATLARRDFESASIVPASQAKNNQKVLLTFAVKKASIGNRGLPQFIVVMINGKAAKAVDDGTHGDAVAGDGIYTAVGMLQGNETMTKTVSAKLVNGIGHSGAAHAASTTKPTGGTTTTTTCTIEGVECPPDCKSTIFHSPCILCFKITCKVVIVTK